MNSLKFLFALSIVFWGLSNTTQAQYQFEKYISLPDTNFWATAAIEHNGKYYVIGNKTNFNPTYLSLADIPASGELVEGTGLICLDNQGNILWNTHINTTGVYDPYYVEWRNAKDMVAISDYIYMPYFAPDIMSLCDTFYLPSGVPTFTFVTSRKIFLAKINATTGEIVQDQLIEPIVACHRHVYPIIDVDDDQNLLLSYYDDQKDSIYALTIDTNLNFLNIKSQYVGSEIFLNYFDSKHNIYVKTAIAGGYLLKKYDTNLNLKWTIDGSPFIRFVEDKLDNGIVGFGFESLYDSVGNLLYRYTKFTKTDSLGNVIIADSICKSRKLDIIYNQQNNLLFMNEYANNTLDTTTFTIEHFDSDFNLIDSFTQTRPWQLFANALFAPSDSGIVIIGSRWNRWNFDVGLTPDDLWFYKCSFGKVATINDTTNINEIDKGKITIYPNPSNGIYQIVTNGVKINYYVVTDIEGKVLLQQNKTEHIDIRNFTNGTYVLKCFADDNRNYTFKLVKYKN